MSKKLQISPSTPEFVSKQDPNYYYKVIMPKLMGDVFRTSVYQGENGKYYFDDVYLGIHIEITENQWSIIRLSNPETDSGKEKIKEFAEFYNEEHIIPASIYNRQQPIVDDLHNVLPIMTFINSKRSNLDIRDIPTNDDMSIETLCFYDGELHNSNPEQMGRGCVRISTLVPFETRYGNKNPKYMGEFTTVSCLFGNCYFEPAPTEYRGLIARTVLYFNEKYSTHPAVDQKKYAAFMPPERLTQMQIWDQTYSPTWYEYQRHQRIFEKTGVENPYTVAALNRMMIKGGQPPPGEQCCVL